MFMKLLDTLSLSTRMFRTRPMRTFLTILGVSVGIGTVLFLVSLGYGLQNIILGQITTADSLLSLDISAGYSGLLQLKEDNIESIKNIPNVAEVSPAATLSAQITMEELTGDGLIYAVDSSFFRLSGIIPQNGEVFNSENEYSVVISTAGAKLFNMAPPEILGKEVYLTLFLPKINDEGFEEVRVEKRKEKYVVKGIIEDDNSNYVFLPLKTISDLKISEYNQAKAKVSSNEAMEEVRNKIIEQGFIVSSLSDTID